MVKLSLFKILLISLWSIAPLSSAFAQAVPNRHATIKAGEFRIEALAGFNLGSTIYELNALTPDPRGSDEIVPIKSRLEFPLDVLLAGGRIIWIPGGMSQNSWSISLKILTNLNNPFSKMTNSDFINGDKIIHTESEAELDFLSASAEIRYLLTDGIKTKFSLLFLMDYQRIKQHIVGYEGWQASLFSGQKFDISSIEPVLDYRVTYTSPQLGAEITYHIASRLMLGFMGSAGVLFASDFDNHILRQRTSEGSGTGFVINATAAVELLPGSFPLDQLSLAIIGNLRYYRSEGGMDQTFLSGDQYLGIPYLFESLQGSVGLAMGFTF